MGSFTISSAGVTAALTNRLFEQVNIPTKTGNSKKAEKAEGRDCKLERIIAKFRMGKKLSDEELSYVAKQNPELYQKILRVLNRREQVEKRLEAAKTKEEEHQIMSQEMKSVENIDDAFEKEATVNHLMDAYHEHISSGASSGKPDTRFELAREKTAEYAKRRPVSDKASGNGDAAKTDTAFSMQSSGESQDAVSPGAHSPDPHKQEASGKEKVPHASAGGKKKAGRKSRPQHSINITV